MLVVMQSQATPARSTACWRRSVAMGLTPHPMPGATRTAIGITGNTGAVDSRTLEVLPGVFELIRVTKPYKLASREMHPARHRRPPAAGRRSARGHFTIIAGPCSVENEAMILRTAEWLMDRGVRLPARRGVQAADQPLRLPGPGAGGARHPRPRPARRRASASSPS